MSTGSLVPAFDPTVTDYAMTALNSVYPIQVTATATDAAAPLVIHGVAAQSGVPITFKLAAGEDITVSLGARTYTVHYIPPDLPVYTVSSTPGAGTEDVLLTPNVQYQLIIDRSGAPLYYRTFQPQVVSDFQQYALPGGQIEYAAVVGTSPTVGWIQGARHIIDAQFRDVADVQLLAGDAEPALPAEGHDFILIDHDHYVAQAYVQRTVDLSGLNPAWSSQALVVYPVVQELVAGSPVFEWDSASVTSLYTDSVFPNKFQAGTPTDYLHMNSMCIDPTDGNFVFSFRNTSSIVKLDRTTGQILWTLGGKEDQFGLTGSQVFAFQHYVRVQPDGSLWVFDNRGAPHTRILSFVLDEVSKRVVTFTDVYDEPSTQPPSNIMGSYAHLDTARYLFGWGGWFTNDIAPAATEISAGSVVWSLTFTAPQTFSYRALPIAPL